MKKTKRNYDEQKLLYTVQYYGQATAARAAPDKGIGAWRPTKKEIKKLQNDVLREVDGIFRDGRCVGIEECRDALDSVIE